MHDACKEERQVKSNHQFGLRYFEEGPPTGRWTGLVKQNMAPILDMPSLKATGKAGNISSNIEEHSRKRLKVEINN